MLILITVIVLLACLLLGIEIAFSLGISAMVGIFIDRTIPFETIAQRMAGSINSFALIAIPLFLLMGKLMEFGGITKKLVNFADALVGRMRGALAQVNILVSIFFAGISGSAVADASSVGSMLIPAMKEEGYEADFSAAVTAASSTLGPIIPPSILMIIYGVATGTSILRLFLAGVIPGLTCGIGMMIITHYIAKKRNYPKREKATLRELLKATRGAISAIVLPVIVILGALTGVFTITEAAGVAALYAFVVSVFIYRKIGAKKLFEAFLEAARSTAVVSILIAMSSLFAWIFTVGGGPELVTSLLTGTFHNHYIILFLMNFYLLILGMLLAPAAGLVISVPLLLPVAKEIGMDLTQLGLLMVFNLNLGLLTPPVAIGLHLCSNIGGIPMEKSFKEAIPYIIISLITLGLITYWPGFSISLSHLMR